MRGLHTRSVSGSGCPLAHRREDPAVIRRRLLKDPLRPPALQVIHPLRAVARSIVTHGSLHCVIGVPPAARAVDVRPQRHLLAAEEVTHHHHHHHIAVPATHLPGRLRLAVTQRSEPYVKIERATASTFKSHRRERGHNSGVWTPEMEAEALGAKGPAPQPAAAAPASKLQLIGVEGEYIRSIETLPISLATPGVITIGRSSSCEVTFAKDDQISRRHVQLTSREGQLWVSDVGSTYACSPAAISPIHRRLSMKESNPHLPSITHP